MSECITSGLAGSYLLIHFFLQGSMSQRTVCTQFTPQLWRATKCKFCFNDKESHEKACKENSGNTNLPPSSTKSPSPKTVKRIGSAYMKSDENLLRSPTRRNTSSNSDEANVKAQSIFSNDTDLVKNRPSRVNNYFPCNNIT